MRVWPLALREHRRIRHEDRTPTREREDVFDRGAVHALVPVARDVAEVRRADHVFHLQQRVVSTQHRLVLVHVARFTAGHEIGHLALHASQIREAIVSGTSQGLRRERSKVPIYKDAEWQADAFAAELLAPRPAVMTLWAGSSAIQRRIFDILVADAFLISRKAALIRVEHLTADGLLG